MRIPLFDIDWTLLQGGNVAHAQSFTHALKTIYGVDGSIDDIDHHGMTDRQALMAVLEHHGVLRDEALAQLPQARQAMIEYFDTHKGVGEYVPLPGVLHTLNELRKRQVRCGLLTGNTEPIARHKLSAAGIHHFFSFGAFGDVTDKRVELIEIARQRCRVVHPELADFEVVIVGDALRDVQCARDGGIEVVAVATGTYSREQLAQAAPDLLLGSLNEVDRLVEFLRA